MKYKSSFKNILEVFLKKLVLNKIYKRCEKFYTFNVSILHDLIILKNHLTIF